MVKSKARLLALFSALTISCINGVFERTLLAQEVANSDHATTKLTQQILKQKLIETCAENSLPGIWAGRFSTKSQPAIVEAAGIRKWDTPEQVDGDDTVHLGSCTKAMTSVIIGQLCTEGKLRLDSTLGEVFSDTAAVTETGWSEVTIQQLLQHRSGVPANFSVYQIFDAKHPDSVVAARNQLVEAIWKQKRPRSPGFVYSNVGFILLGHIAEKSEGKSWEEIITKRLFQPLGMTSAGFGPVGRPDGTPDSADV